MNILSSLLFTDIGCRLPQSPLSSQKWTFSDRLEMATSWNIIFLGKGGDYILLTDQYAGEEDPTELKMSRQQLVQLIDEWQERVCKTKLKEVIIKHENNVFIIEMND